MLSISVSSGAVLLPGVNVSHGNALSNCGHQIRHDDGR